MSAADRHPLSDAVEGLSDSELVDLVDDLPPGAVLAMLGVGAGDVAPSRYRAQQLLDGDEVDTVDDHVALWRAMIGEAVALQQLWTETMRTRFTPRAAREVGRSIDRVVSLVEGFEKLGLEERRVRVEEARVRRIGDAVRRALRDLGVNADDATVRAALRKRLEELDDTTDSPEDADG